MVRDSLISVLHQLLISSWLCQRRMFRLFQANRKAATTQITICYHQGMQNNISDADWPQQQKTTLLPLSAKNKKKLKFTWTHRNWTTEDWKNILYCDVLNFCCNIWTIGSELRVNAIKASWVHPVLHQQFRLIMV